MTANIVSIVQIDQAKLHPFLWLSKSTTIVSTQEWQGPQGPNRIMICLIPFIGSNCDSHTQVIYNSDNYVTCNIF